MEMEGLIRNRKCGEKGKDQEAEKQKHGRKDGMGRAGREEEYTKGSRITVVDI